MPKMIEMIGKRFGRLTVLRELPSTTMNRERRYECRCQCGALTTVRGAALRKGIVKSCGCWRRDGYRETWHCYDGTFDALSDFFASLVDGHGWRMVSAETDGGDATVRYHSRSRQCRMTVPPFTLFRLSDDGEDLETRPAWSMECRRLEIAGGHSSDVFLNCRAPKEVADAD